MKAKKQGQTSPYPLVSVAPMMGWTDRHDRYFLRLISPHALLYTVMITTGALVHGQKFEVLDFSPEEHPLVLQLGGSDPVDMAACAVHAEKHGYDAVNINCGCPSERVQKGAFGACLMAEPRLVATCVDRMRQTVSIPVTVKTRIGIDQRDDYGFVRDFIGTVADKGCDTFVVHARKALLKGLSPAENRTVPPLNYETVYRLKRDFPQLTIILNGGLKTVSDVKTVLPHVDGVMIGREAYSNPWFLHQLDLALHPDTIPLDPFAIVQAMKPYIEMMRKQDIPLKDITRHMLGLFQGMKGARTWRRILSEDAYKEGAGFEVVTRALASVADHPQNRAA